MNIGIDASNIRTGGGKKHLENFILNSLSANDNLKFTLVSNKKIIDSFYSIKNVKCISNKLLNFSNVTSFISQLLFSNRYFKKNNCDIVFVPGGIFLSSFRPFVAMSQNMLPFDLEEVLKFDKKKIIKFLIIKKLQLRTFKRARGIIFLTKYAQTTIFKSGNFTNNSVVIPHGIEQMQQNSYESKIKPFHILYVSDFLPYKNQYEVVNSVANLISLGYDFELTLIGKIDKKQYNKINKLRSKNKSFSKRIKILGYKSSVETFEYYLKCSVFLFASTCENLPFILLEAMSLGIPILTTNKSPMSDIVSDKGVLFDVNDPKSIEKVILENYDLNKLKKLSNNNFQLSKKYNIKKSVDRTINFISENSR